MESRVSRASGTDTRRALPTLMVDGMVRSQGLTDTVTGIEQLLGSGVASMSFQISLRVTIFPLRVTISLYICNLQRSRTRPNSTSGSSSLLPSREPYRRDCGKADTHIISSTESDLSMLLGGLSTALLSVSTLKDQGAASQAMRVHAHDYSCVARGQVFVAQSWLSDELLKALRADVRHLLDDGFVCDTSEPIGKRLKLELFTQHWTAPGESEPSEARRSARRLFDTLRVELESVMGRRLILDQMGAQAKFTIGKIGQPVRS